MTANETISRPHRLRRIAARTGIGIAAVVVLLVVALLIPGVRGALLREAIDRAGAALPGTIAVEAARWPAPGTLDISGLLWTDGGDTLARAERVRVEARLWPLVRRDVVVEAVEVTGAAADIPAITARLPASADTATTPNETGGSTFPRAGSLAGVPSIAVRRLAVTADSIRVGPGDVLAGIDVAANADLLHGGHPSARIERLAVHGKARAWGIDEVDLDVDLGRGVMDGRIRGRAGHWPFFVTLASDGPDRYTVTATTVEGATPPADVGARVAFELERRGLAVDRVGITADIRTPGVAELAADPSLSGALAAAPPLEGVVARIDADVALAPGPAVDATLRIEPNAWLEGVDAAVSWHDGVTDVPRARVALDGLELLARAHVSRDSLRAHARATVTSGAWLAALRPGQDPPGGLEGVVEVTARAAMPLERVDVDLLAGAMGTYLGVNALAVLGDELTLELSPLLVRSTPVANAPARGRAPGTVRRSADGTLSARGVRVTGDFGNARIDADLDDRGHGDVAAAIAWPRLPAAAAARLGLEPETTDSLRAAWKRDGPFGLNARARVGRDIEARVDIDLPGPRTLAPLLPAGANVADLGHLTGAIDARVGGGPDAAVDVTADLGTTAWIDTARAVVRVRADTVSVDAFELALATLRVAGAGTIRADSLDLAGRVHIGDASFLRRFAPAAPDVSLSLEGAVSGERDAPGVAADLAATVDGIAVAGRARVGADGADIRLHAPDGLTAGPARFDVVEVTLTNNGAGIRLFPAAVTVDVSGEDVALYHAATVDTTGGFSLAADTLAIQIGGRDITTRRPFHVRAGPEAGRIVVAGVDMAGALGHLTLDAELCADSVVADADIDVNMPDKPESLVLPENYWPKSAALRARVRADGHVDADLRVGGIMLADGSRPDIEASVDFAGEDVSVLASITAGDTLLLDARARIPAALSLSPFAFDAGDGDAEIEIHMRDIPVSLRTDGNDRERVVRVSGDARIVGTMSAPAGTLSAVVTFPDWPKLADYRVAFESVVNAGTGDDAVDARLRLLRGDEVRLRATVAYAGALSMEPPFIPEDGSGRLDVAARSDSLQLSEFDNLLPSDVGLTGALAIRLDAKGPPRNPALDGRLDVSGVEVTVQQRMRLVSNGSVTVGGVVAEPVVRGKVVIENGVIQIPDPPKTLHPVSGPALLIEQPPVGVDSTVVAPQPAREPATTVPGDVDITVEIPGGLWIRGQGLEVELAGDLRVRAQNERPTLTGELRAVRGNLIMLGRSFDLEHGTVVFYGDDDANPSLDVQLSTSIDGTRITVELTGTALEPELSLRSSPEMEEGDIMSYLVFGRTLDNLDEDQKGLVATRATEIAAAMGAVRLQDELREQLGVDLVTIRGSTADEEASALVVGKYINPRLLVKYEQLLEEQAAQFINIEYFLTRRLKLETLYGRHDQQGVELEWSNKY